MLSGYRFIWAVFTIPKIPLSFPARVWEFKTTLTRSSSIASGWPADVFWKKAPSLLAKRSSPLPTKWPMPSSMITQKISPAMKAAAVSTTLAEVATRDARIGMV